MEKIIPKLRLKESCPFLFARKVLLFILFFILDKEKFYLNSFL